MAKLGNVLNKIGSLYQSLTKSEKKLPIRFCVRLIWYRNVPFLKLQNT